MAEACLTQRALRTRYARRSERPDVAPPGNSGGIWASLGAITAVALPVRPAGYAYR